MDYWTHTAPQSQSQNVEPERAELQSPFSHLPSPAVSLRPLHLLPGGSLSSMTPHTYPPAPPSRSHHAYIYLTPSDLRPLLLFTKGSIVAFR
jgi:hypothetical protein